jgi:hypothetical protein
MYFCVSKLFSVKSTLYKVSFLLLAAIAMAYNSHSQFITAADKKRLREKEDTLQEYARYLITDTLTEERMVSDSIFTRTLVRALQVKNSFYYPFDSVMGVSKLYAPDSTFRIFTWNIQFDDYYGRQRGAIQLKTRDGSLKLLPLRDVSEFTTKPEDSVRSRSNWIGAVYYNMVKTQHNGRNYYTLFGIDYNAVRSTKKWIEVMYFNEKNEPVFGGPFFSYAKDSVPKPDQHRFSIEFKKDARILANYVPDLELILVDHLVSENDDPDNKGSYIPDGDNEAYKWENGKWVHIDKAFDFKVDMTGADTYLGRPPMGEPILDSKGNRNEKKLQDKSDKNKIKEKPPINYDN